MNRLFVLLVVLATAATACGGDSSTASTSSAETTSAEVAESGASASTTAPGESSTEPSGSEDGVTPGSSVNICEMIDTTNLATFVDFPVVVGEPFFSGSDMNSCDWESPEDASIDQIGSVSFRLQKAASFVIIDPSPFELEVGGHQASVEPKYGQTNVYLGESVLTVQVNGNDGPSPDISTRYPDLAAPAEGLAKTTDVLASVAIAEAFLEEFTG